MCSDSPTNCYDDVRNYQCRHCTHYVQNNHSFNLIPNMISPIGLITCNLVVPSKSYGPLVQVIRIETYYYYHYIFLYPYTLLVIIMFSQDCVSGLRYSSYMYNHINVLSVFQIKHFIQSFCVSVWMYVIKSSIMK